MTEYLTAEQVGVQLGVSRETLERLKIYVELLLKWQRAINLIGPGTIADDVVRKNLASILLGYDPIENLDVALGLAPAPSPSTDADEKEEGEEEQTLNRK